MTQLRTTTITFGDEPSQALSNRIHAATRSLLEDAPDGVTDLVPGYTTLMLEWDEHRTQRDTLASWLAKAKHYATSLDDVPDAQAQHQVRTIRVRYDGDDLESVALQTGRTVQDVIAEHTAATYLVHALGFTPGFPFLGDLPSALHLPRRGTPRASVPAHSVAIAGRQTGVYPIASPGGWHLLGTALESLYDPTRDEPFLLHPGDWVRFEQGEGKTPAEPEVMELLPTNPERPVFGVLQAGLLDLVVDQGRERVGRFGLARSGPVDAAAARHANRLLGNAEHAPLLEINLHGPRLDVLTNTVIAFSGSGGNLYRGDDVLEPDTSHRLRPGETLSFRPGTRGMRGYLAVAGGIESRSFLGSASTDVRGRIGRPLRAGDLLGMAEAPTARAGFHLRRWRPYPHLKDPVVVRIRPGPQEDPESFDALTRTPFRVMTADRMGVRLAGPQVPGGEVTSEGVPIGAVQVTSDGQPLILLHDRGSLGGYAKPAIVVPEDLSAIAQLRPGQCVKFVMATISVT